MNIVDTFITANTSKLRSEDLIFLKEKEAASSDTELHNMERNLARISLKTPIFSLFLSVFLGSLGIDRFYVGDTGLGVAKLLTFGACGIWTLVDLLLIYDRTLDVNRQQLMSRL